MTDEAYRLAAHLAITRQLRRYPVRVKEQTRAILARLQAQRHLRSRLGLMTLPPAVRRSAPQIGEPERIAGYRASLFAEYGAPGIALRQTLARLAGANRPLPNTTGAGPIPVAWFTSAGESRVGPARFAGAFPGPFAHPVTVPRVPAALARRSAGVASAPSGPRLAAWTMSSGESPQRAVIAASNISTRARHQIATAPTQPAITPGFHRTVRQPQAKAAAGNVYLDKTLVGYHLAAAITAEQTRAAARPNFSGTNFNSSMAVLRPSGAGL